MNEVLGPSQVVIGMAIISICYLILPILLILTRARAPETKLLLIGVFMAITAAVQSSLTPAGVNAPPGTTWTGLASAPLMRIATILVLAGVGMMFLDRATPPAEKGGPHVG
jgi:hypothetical protein